MFLLKAVILLVRGILSERAKIAVENLALRQNITRPKIRNHDRIFWVWLSNLWSNWRSALIIVKPDTVIRCKGFRLYWRWKSKKRKNGRPKVEQEIRALIHRMRRENPIWGAPRIQAELTLLGYEVAESTVAKYMIHGLKPPSQTWRTFLKNHTSEIAAIDFFTAPTVSSAFFTVLWYCFTIGEAVFTSMLQNILRPNGPLSRSLMLSLTMKHPDICFVTVIQYTADSFSKLCTDEVFVMDMTILIEGTGVDQPAKRKSGSLNY